MTAAVESAELLLKVYDTSRSVETLERAYDQVFGLEPAHEDVAGRDRLLVAWLGLLKRISEGLDPRFNPEDLPALSLVPLRENGLPGEYPSGTKPADVKDPGMRKRYEQALAANDRKTVTYRTQSVLRRLDSRATHDVAAFIDAYFSKSTADQARLAALLAKSGLEAVRVRALSAPRN